MFLSAWVWPPTFEMVVNPEPSTTNKLSPQFKLLVKGSADGDNNVAAHLAFLTGSVECKQYHFHSRVYLIGPHPTEIREIWV